MLLNKENTAVLLFCCNRPEYLDRSIKSVLKNKQDFDFPFIVSQDGGDEIVTSVIQSYEDQIIHIQLFDDEINEDTNSESDGYGYISRHYKWAFDKIFNDMGFEFAIILEDDLEIAPDFFNYITSCAEIMKNDNSIWTVSAWNDNGFEPYVKDPFAVYRSDFFPGLGWLMNRRLWTELRPKWPRNHWDMWMRDPEQRKGRVSLRPEINRTFTFGEWGVSNGCYFHQYLKHIKLNQKPVQFNKLDLTYLIKENYDKIFLRQLEEAHNVKLKDPLKGNDAFRIEYDRYEEFEMIADHFNLMKDINGGVLRTGYHGVVSFRFKGKMIHIAPSNAFKSFNL